jgi:hypothetical protein
MKRCAQCGRPENFPSPEEIGLRLEGGNRGWVSARVYAALQRPGGATLDELRKAAWPNGEARSEDTIYTMLNRLDQRLGRYGVAIARVGVAVADRTYRLVGL